MKYRYGVPVPSLRPDLVIVANNGLPGRFVAPVTGPSYYLSAVTLVPPNNAMRARLKDGDVWHDYLVRVQM